EKMAAISTIGQFLPEFEAAPDASAWDRIAQMSAAAMAKASREEKMAAISTIGQFLPEFEAAPDASAWDRIAQMS
ncbi:hypothetical protein CNY89_29750, partial [Amaricoccus sp. HAR-UPW-R2A-40]